MNGVAPPVKYPRRLKFELIVLGAILAVFFIGAAMPAGSTLNGLVIDGTLIFVFLGAAVLLVIMRFVHAGEEYRNYLALYGETPEERQQVINTRFDKAEGDVHHVVNHKEDGARLHCTIRRSLVSMPKKEREALRGLELLFNAGQFELSDYHVKRFALIWGDGKGMVDPDHNFRMPKKGDDDTGADNTSTITDMINWYKGKKGTSVEASVSFITSVIGQLEKAAPDHDLVRNLSAKFRGGGAWITKSELQNSIFTTEPGRGLHLGYLDGTDIEVNYDGEGSMITIAPPGSGKTQCNVFPALLSWTGPAVVLDVKGEIYDQTSKWRAENVGPVFKFAPLDPDNSHSFNPLTFVRWEDDYIWEDSRFLADMMIVPSGAKDPFWENKARDVLTAAIALECSLNAPEERSLSRILDILHGLDWDEFIIGLDAAEISSMRRAGKALSDMDDKMRQSVFQQAQSSLSAWMGTRIEKSTRKSDWSPLDLRKGDNPTIYICLTPNEVDSYISILRVLISMHIRTITGAGIPDRDEKVDILMMLDELPRLRHMPPVEEALEIGRQYGLRLWLFAQSTGQLKDAYKNADGMIGSCAVRVFMNPSLQDGTAKKIAEDLGHEETALDSSRKLMVEPNELAGPAFKDLQIVMAASTKPAKVVKHFAWQDEAISSRMGKIE